MSRDCCVALPRGAMVLSVVCDCGILTILGFFLDLVKPAIHLLYFMIYF